MSILQRIFFYLILPAHIFRTATLGCTRDIYCYAESAFNGIYQEGKKPQIFISYTAQWHINFERMSPPPQKKIMRKSKDRAYFETFGSLVHPTATFGTGYKYWISSTDEYIDRSSSEYLRMSGVLLSICSVRINIQQ